MIVWLHLISGELKSACLCQTVSLKYFHSVFFSIAVLHDNADLEVNASISPQSFYNIKLHENKNKSVLLEFTASVDRVNLKCILHCFFLRGRVQCGGAGLGGIHIAAERCRAGSVLCLVMVC